jgi:uncharacterized protein (DUF362 family)
MGLGLVALVRTTDRAAGVKRAVELLERNPVRGKAVFLKPNFNSAHPPPGSTDTGSIQTMVEVLRSYGATRITIGDRSGMGDTAAVMRSKDIFRLADELGLETIVFDDLDAEGWTRFEAEGGHWQRGFAFAKPILDSDGIVQMGCLKTHRYGGHFTLSLKNSVGMVAKFVPGEGYNYMNELHGSDHQRRMIAEINTAYEPDLVLIDGVEAFVHGGPAQGTKVAANVVLASADRVAIDAVGVAILRYFGTTPEVQDGSIFTLEQIARAVELGLGVAEAKSITLVTGDQESAAFKAEIEPLLYAS